MEIFLEKEQNELFYDAVNWIGIEMKLIEI